MIQGCDFALRPNIFWKSTILPMRTSNCLWHYISVSLDYSDLCCSTRTISKLRQRSSNSAIRMFYFLLYLHDCRATVPAACIYLCELLHFTGPDGRQKAPK